MRICEQKVVNNTEVLKTAKGIYVSSKVCGQIVKFLVDTSANVSLILLNSLKKFPDMLSSKWKDQSLEIYTVNGEKVKTWRSVQVNLEVKDVTITTQIYASDMLELDILGLPTLKNLQAIVDLEKEELFVKKPVEEPEIFESILKTLSVFMNRGKVVELWTEIAVQGRVAGSPNENIEG